MDTACLRALGGPPALDEHAQNLVDPSTEKGSRKLYRGQREVGAGIGGVPRKLRFEQVDKDIPMLIRPEPVERS